MTSQSLAVLYPSGSEISRFWYSKTQGRKINVENIFCCTYQFIVEILCSKQKICPSHFKLARVSRLRVSQLLFHVSNLLSINFCIHVGITTSFVLRHFLKCGSMRLLFFTEVLLRLFCRGIS